MENHKDELDMSHDLSLEMQCYELGNLDRPDLTVSVSILVHNKKFISPLTHSYYVYHPCA